MLGLHRRVPLRARQVCTSQVREISSAYCVTVLLNRRAIPFARRSVAVSRRANAPCLVSAKRPSSVALANGRRGQTEAGCRRSGTTGKLEFVTVPLAAR